MPNPISSAPNQSLLPTEGDPDSLACVNPSATAAGPSSSALATPPALEAANGESVRPEMSRATAVEGLVSQFTKPSATGTAVGVEEGFYKHQQQSTDGEFELGSMGLYNLQNPDGSGATALELSIQKGQDKNVQVTVARSNFAIDMCSGFGLSLSGDVGVFRANIGVHNDDGSVGHNIGLMAEAAGLEATVTTPVASVTLGASVSDGIAGSSGVRDADHDGKPEYCAKVSIPAFTVGACLERFW